MSGPIMIGVDHGYAAMKTTHCAFPTGLVEYEHEPYTQKDVLEYGGRFYVVGSGRQPLQKDKTRTEDYYLLTLAAIARELDHRSVETTADIHLAAGLPLTSFGRDKKSFRDYLYREGRPRLLPLRGQGLHHHRPAGVPVPPGLCRRPDPDGAAGRTLRHRGGHWRLDSGSDASGPAHPQRRHLPQPGAGHDPLCG